MQSEAPDAIIVPADSGISNIALLSNYTSRGGVIVGLGDSSGNVLNALNPFTK